MSKMLGKVLKLLDERDMTQAELESRAGLSRQRISNLKEPRKGRSRLTGDEVFRIARALGVSADYLLDDDAALPVPEHSEEVSRILWLAEQIGHDVAIRRLISAPGVTVQGPTYGEIEKKRPPRGKVPDGGRNGNG